MKLFTTALPPASFCPCGWFRNPPSAGLRGCYSVCLSCRRYKMVLSSEVQVAKLSSEYLPAVFFHLIL